MDTVVHLMNSWIQWVKSFVYPDYSSVAKSISKKLFIKYLSVPLFLSCVHHYRYHFSLRSEAPFVINSFNSVQVVMHWFALNLQWLFKDIKTKCSFIASWGITFGMNSQVLFVVKKDHVGIYDTAFCYATIENFARKMRKRQWLLCLIKPNKLAFDKFDCFLSLIPF